MVFAFTTYLSKVPSNLLVHQCTCNGVALGAMHAQRRLSKCVAHTIMERHYGYLCMVYAGRTSHLYYPWQSVCCKRSMSVWHCQGNCAPSGSTAAYAMYLIKHWRSGTVRKVDIQSMALVNVFVKASGQHLRRNDT